MRNRLVTGGRGLVACCVMVLGLVGCAGDTTKARGEGEVREQVQTKLTKSFHNLQVDDVKASEIPGVYEVYVGSKVIYYAPDQDILVFGELYRSDGHSITADKVSALQAQRAGTIDKDAAVAVGDGPTEVIAFVDPDCGYCRRAHDWLQQQQLQGHITELLYFMPMPGRPDAIARAENLICAPPALRQAAYDELWSREGGEKAALLKCDGAQKKLAEQAKEAMRFGVQGTPTFIVKGQVVPGFQPDRLIALLNSKE